MRLGIDYRLIASRENLVNRGIGRYTQQQLRHVLQLDTANEYVLLCPPGGDVSLVLPEIRSATNVSMAFEPEPASPPPADPYDRRGLLRRSAEYQDWILGLGVDLYHSTAPFVLEQTAPPAFDACPMVATVYDFIPLIFPGEYLHDSGRRSAYAGAARLVRSATRLIAISDGTREDAVNYLGFRREAVDCAWPFADACFRPLADDVVAGALRSLDRRVGLPERFVLTVAALHHTKNLELLFAAYSRLSPLFRRSLPLVVACHLDDVGAAHVRRWAATFGVADDLVITGYVPDDELAALYNRAVLVAHPSRYEGFGLPVVEAMQCGAAVITTTAPSLPEVTAGAAVLVDPDDAAGLAVAIVGLAGDSDARDRMGEAGLVRAAAYTPEALARATLASYEVAVTGTAATTGRRRVALCTPAADALDLLRKLPRNCDIEVFTDDEDGPLPDALLDRVPVHHRGALARGAFDVVIADVDADVGGEPDGVVATSTAGHWNRLCDAADLADHTTTSAWSTAMSTEVLDHFGLRGPGARVLWQGSGGLAEAFRLTGEVAEVTLAAPWVEIGTPLARALLVDPRLVAGGPSRPSRLVVRHADLRRLPFTDGAFDAVVGCKALDDLDEDEVAGAMSEAARVVRPGGVLALSLTVRLHGPVGAPGFPLDRVVGGLLPATGLEPVDDLRLEVSPETMAGRRAFSAAFGPTPPDSDRPLMLSGGALLGCLHLALRRNDQDIYRMSSMRP